MNWPAINCHPANFADLNREFYLLSRNVMHGAAYSMRMYVIPSIDVPRSLHTRWDELRQRLYFVAQGENISEAKLSSFAFAIATHSSHKLVYSTPLKIAQMDRILSV